MQKPEEIFFELIGKKKNIYQAATLYPQKRKKISSYIEILKDPYSDENLELEGDVLKSSTNRYAAKDDVANFGNNDENSQEWIDLNQQFLNYHKSLTVYDLINSISGVNYLSLKSKIGLKKNIKVLDVGGGTGHTFCSFFQYPETIEYFLMDANLRLLHDQFIKIYPKLTFLEMGHILGNAEVLPIKDNTFDLVINLAAIDHLNDYKKAIAESLRVLVPGGIFLVSSHLDGSSLKHIKQSKFSNMFSTEFMEKLTRRLYTRKLNVGKDDHTLHLKDSKPIEDELLKQGFIIEDKEEYKNNFYYVAKKEI